MALNYLFNRGITEADLWFYGIGLSQKDQNWGGRIEKENKQKIGCKN